MEEVEGITLRPLAFLGTLCIYLLTLAGNLFIIVLVQADAGLSTPMYFFISVLSFLELWYVSTTAPTLLRTWLRGRSPIPAAVSFTQLYVFHSLGMTECYLLGVTALDRYLAVCRPLHYHALMSRKVGATWVAGFSAALAPASLTASLPFCFREVAPYFCDLAPLMRLACVDTGWDARVHGTNECPTYRERGLPWGIYNAFSASFRPQVSCSFYFAIQRFTQPPFTLTKIHASIQKTDTLTSMLLEDAARPESPLGHRREPRVKGLVLEDDSLVKQAQITVKKSRLREQM
ncbi:hypothetical protein GH733_010445 [Mirounga leonina]|nr:hypothetical protein GH733_010445 [Mirounga leonina]